MKILWFTNIMFSELGKELGRNTSNSGGWMHQFKKAFSNNENFELAITSFDIASTTLFSKKINNIQFYNLPKKERNAHIYDTTVESYIDQVIEEFSPDIVHIWGSEFPHSLAVANICKNKNVKFVVSIQGVVYDIANHYCDGIPHSIIKRYTFRDFLRHDNILMQQKKMGLRGQFEKKCLSITDNVIGRTDYDFSLVKEVNPNIHYYYCNECLRHEFYAGERWNIENIERHSIYLSQAYYPIKGFHFLLQALKIVKEKYKDVKVYVAGGYYPIPTNLNVKIRQSSYDKYIQKLINDFDLNDNIVFLGSLNEKEVKEKMLKVHLSVSPSLIENKSNSLGEAMILGIPVIGSFVGGVTDLIDHKINGLLYPFNQSSMLAQYIIYIFEHDQYANYLSNNSIIKASEVFNIDTNVKQMVDIYKKIIYSKNYD